MLFFCTRMTSGLNLLLGSHPCSLSISIAIWNIHTLVESASDDCRICRVRPDPKTNHLLSTGPNFVNRKLDFLVKELRRLKVAVAGIQETKWLEQDVWNADGYTLLHSGRTLCSDGEPLRNEGVGIVLDQSATATCKNVGEC